MSIIILIIVCLCCKGMLVTQTSLACSASFIVAIVSVRCSVRTPAFFSESRSESLSFSCASICMLLQTDTNITATRYSARAKVQNYFFPFSLSPQSRCYIAAHFMSSSSHERMTIIITKLIRLDIFM